MSTSASRRAAGTPAALRLLQAPVLPTIGRLAAPGVLLSVFQTAVSVGDTYFVGRLGTTALAGLALVFPLLMLLQMLSAGAMGGGVASAVARALGAGDERAARALVAHALVIALAIGLAFTVLLLAFGRPLYALLGGQGAALASALSYSGVVFGGATLVWIANTFASVLRGSGNTLVPSLVLVAAALLHLVLSGTLVTGASGLPRLGIAGAGVAFVCAFGFAALALGAYLWSSALRPRAEDWRLEWRRFRDILRVGAVSSLSSLQTVLTAVILTGFVGRHGTAALAGYGVGMRLELLQVPLVFSIGQAMVPLVGTAVGAGLPARARQAAWTGAAIAGSISLVIGVTVACFPMLWLHIFSTDPAVLEAGRWYLRIVAPFYVFFGASVALYFASQGAGRMRYPVLAASARLVIVVAGAALLTASGAPLWSLFTVVALGMLAFGGITALGVRRMDWTLR